VGRVVGLSDALSFAPAFVKLLGRGRVGLPPVGQTSQSKRRSCWRLRGTVGSGLEQARTSVVLSCVVSDVRVVASTRYGTINSRR
jgi:hypothetical protein